MISCAVRAGGGGLRQLPGWPPNSSKVSGKKSHFNESTFTSCVSKFLDAPDCLINQTIRRKTNSATMLSQKKVSSLKERAHSRNFEFRRLTAAATGLRGYGVLTDS